MKTVNIYKTEPNETNAWFRLPLCHPAKKWIALILRLLGPTWG